MNSNKNLKMSNKILSSSKIQSLRSLDSLRTKSHSQPSSLRKSYFSNSSINPTESSDEEDKDKNTEKMKVKLMSLWNNVKYGKYLFMNQIDHNYYLY